MFIGLVGEIFIIFAFSKDKPRAETVLSFVCGLIIAIGVYGEYTFGSRAAHAADQLQEISDRQVAALKLEAANARLEQERLAASNLELQREIAQIGKETAQANGSAAQANRDVSEARKDALSLKRDIGAADSRAAQAELRTAEINLELAKLKYTRNIGPEKQTQAAKILGVFAGTKFSVSVTPDPESTNLMRVIVSILHSAKWVQVSAKGPTSLEQLAPAEPLIGINVNSGVIIESDPSRKSDLGFAATMLVIVLMQSQIDVAGSVAVTGVIPPDAIHVIIGKKP